MSRTPDNGDLALGAARRELMEEWQTYWRLQGMRNNPSHKTESNYIRIPALLS